MRISLSVLILLMLAISAQAQKWDLGVSVGASGYAGDLNQRNLSQVSGFQAAGFVRHNFNGYMSVKLGFTRGEIGATDSTSRYQQFRDRNLSFHTTLNELALTGEFNFMEYVPEIGRNRFTPYVYAGVAVVDYTPRANYQGTAYDLRELGTEGQNQSYRTAALAIPFGAGIKYNISGKLTFMVDAGYRTAYTDYLDDVSGAYADKARFTNPIALALSDRSGERTGIYTRQAGTQRGDYRKHDTYMFFSVGISYTFMSQKCYF
jgi:hypothetical protein